MLLFICDVHDHRLYVAPRYAADEDIVDALLRTPNIFHHDLLPISQIVAGVIVEVKLVFAFYIEGGRELVAMTINTGHAEMVTGSLHLQAALQTEGSQLGTGEEDRLL